VGGGSNAIGIFHEFVGEPGVRLIGVEAAGEGLDRSDHAATLVAGSPGVLHGAKSYLLQDAHGQVLETRSIAPGLDYPGTGPEHSYFKDSGRITYVAVTDNEALEGFQLLSRVEGIIPALEPSHAIAYVAKIAPEMGSDQILVLNLSGRGDKDISIAAEAMGIGL
jgi:tryptophan synthase beta chain